MFDGMKGERAGLRCRCIGRSHLRCQHGAVPRRNITTERNAKKGSGTLPNVLALVSKSNVLTGLEIYLCS